MNKPVQIITSPSGEKLVILPEADYLMLLAASEEDEELKPEVLSELRARREAATQGQTVSFDSLRTR